MSPLLQFKGERLLWRCAACIQADVPASTSRRILRLFPVVRTSADHVTPMRDKALSVALQPPPEDWQWRTSQDTTSPVENVAVEPVQCEARVDCEHVFEYTADQSSAIWLSASFYA